MSHVVFSPGKPRAVSASRPRTAAPRTAASPAKVRPSTPSADRHGKGGKGAAMAPLVALQLLPFETEEGQAVQRALLDPKSTHIDLAGAGSKLDQREWSHVCRALAAHPKVSSVSVICVEITDFLLRAFAELLKRNRRIVSFETDAGDCVSEIRGRIERRKGNQSGIGEYDPTALPEPVNIATTRLSSATPARSSARHSAATPAWTPQPEGVLSPNRADAGDTPSPARMVDNTAIRDLSRVDSSMTMSDVSLSRSSTMMSPEKRRGSHTMSTSMLRSEGTMARINVAPRNPQLVADAAEDAQYPPFKFSTLEERTRNSPMASMSPSPTHGRPDESPQRPMTISPSRSGVPETPKAATPHAAARRPVSAGARPVVRSAATPPPSTPPKRTATPQGAPPMASFITPNRRPAPRATTAGAKRSTPLAANGPLRGGPASLAATPQPVGRRPVSCSTARARPASGLSTARLGAWPQDVIFGTPWEHKKLRPLRLSDLGPDYAAACAAVAETDHEARMLLIDGVFRPMLAANERWVTEQTKLEEEEVLRRKVEESQRTLVSEVRRITWIELDMRGELERTRTKWIAAREIDEKEERRRIDEHVAKRKARQRDRDRVTDFHRRVDDGLAQNWNDRVEFLLTIVKALEELHRRTYFDAAQALQRDQLRRRYYTSYDIHRRQELAREGRWASKRAACLDQFVEVRRGLDLEEKAARARWRELWEQQRCFEDFVAGDVDARTAEIEHIKDQRRIETEARHAAGQEKNSKDHIRGGEQRRHLEDKVSTAELSTRLKIQSAETTYRGALKQLWKTLHPEAELWASHADARRRLQAILAEPVRVVISVAPENADGSADDGEPPIDLPDQGPPPLGLLPAPSVQLTVPGHRPSQKATTVGRGASLMLDASEGRSRRGTSPDSTLSGSTFGATPMMAAQHGHGHSSEESSLVIPRSLFTPLPYIFTGPSAMPRHLFPRAVVSVLPSTDDWAARAHKAAAAVNATWAAVLDGELSRQERDGETGGPIVNSGKFAQKPHPKRFRPRRKSWKLRAFLRHLAERTPRGDDSESRESARTVESESSYDAYDDAAGGGAARITGRSRHSTTSVKDLLTEGLSGEFGSVRSGAETPDPRDDLPDGIPMAGSAEEEVAADARVLGRNPTTHPLPSSAQLLGRHNSTMPSSDGSQANMAGSPSKGSAVLTVPKILQTMDNVSRKIFGFPSSVGSQFIYDPAAVDAPRGAYAALAKPPAGTFGSVELPAPEALERKLVGVWGGEVELLFTITSAPAVDVVDKSQDHNAAVEGLDVADGFQGFGDVPAASTDGEAPKAEANPADDDGNGADATVVQRTDVALGDDAQDLATEHGSSSSSSASSSAASEEGNVSEDEDVAAKRPAADAFAALTREDKAYEIALLRCGDTAPNARTHTAPLKKASGHSRSSSEALPAACPFTHLRLVPTEGFEGLFAKSTQQTLAASGGVPCECVKEEIVFGEAAAGCAKDPSPRSGGGGGLVQSPRRKSRSRSLLLSSRNGQALAALQSETEFLHGRPRKQWTMRATLSFKPSLGLATAGSIQRALRSLRLSAATLSPWASSLTVPLNIDRSLSATADSVVLPSTTLRSQETSSAGQRGRSGTSIGSRSTSLDGTSAGPPRRAVVSIAPATIHVAATMTLSVKPLRLTDAQTVVSASRTYTTDGVRALTAFVVAPPPLFVRPLWERQRKLLLKRLQLYDDLRDVLQDARRAEREDAAAASSEQQPSPPRGSKRVPSVRLDNAIDVMEEGSSTDGSGADDDDERSVRQSAAFAGSDVLQKEVIREFFKDPAAFAVKSQRWEIGSRPVSICPALTVAPPVPLCAPPSAFATVMAATNDVGGLPSNPIDFGYGEGGSFRGGGSRSSTPQFDAETTDADLSVSESALPVGHVIIPPSGTPSVPWPFPVLPSQKQEPKSSNLFQHTAGETTVPCKERVSATGAGVPPSSFGHPAPDTARSSDPTSPTSPLKSSPRRKRQSTSPDMRKTSSGLVIPTVHLGFGTAEGRSGRRSPSRSPVRTPRSTDPAATAFEAVGYTVSRLDTTIVSGEPLETAPEELPSKVPSHNRHTASPGSPIPMASLGVKSSGSSDGGSRSQGAAPSRPVGSGVNDMEQATLPRFSRRCDGLVVAFRISSGATAADILLLDDTHGCEIDAHTGALSVDGVVIGRALRSSLRPLNVATVVAFENGCDVNDDGDVSAAGNTQDATAERSQRGSSAGRGRRSISPSRGGSRPASGKPAAARRGSVGFQAFVEPADNARDGGKAHAGRNRTQSTAFVGVEGGRGSVAALPSSTNAAPAVTLARRRTLTSLNALRKVQGHNFSHTAWALRFGFSGQNATPANIERFLRSVVYTNRSFSGDEAGRRAIHVEAGYARSIMRLRSDVLVVRQAMATRLLLPPAAPLTPAISDGAVTTHHVADVTVTGTPLFAGAALEDARKESFVGGFLRVNITEGCRLGDRLYVDPAVCVAIDGASTDEAFAVSRKSTGAEIAQMLHRSLMENTTGRQGVDDPEVMRRQVLGADADGEASADPEDHKSVSQPPSRPGTADRRRGSKSDRRSSKAGSASGSRRNSGVDTFVNARAPVSPSRTGPQKYDVIPDDVFAEDVASSQLKSNISPHTARDEAQGSVATDAFLITPVTDETRDEIKFDILAESAAAIRANEEAATAAGKKTAQFALRRKSDNKLLGVLSLEYPLFAKTAHNRGALFDQQVLQTRLGASNRAARRGTTRKSEGGSPTMTAAQKAARRAAAGLTTEIPEVVFPNHEVLTGIEPCGIRVDFSVTGECTMDFVRRVLGSIRFVNACFAPQMGTRHVSVEMVLGPTMEQMAAAPPLRTTSNVPFARAPSSIRMLQRLEKKKSALLAKTLSLRPQRTTSLSPSLLHPAAQPPPEIAVSDSHGQADTTAESLQGSTQDSVGTPLGRKDTALLTPSGAVEAGIEDALNNTATSLRSESSVTKSPTTKSPRKASQSPRSPRTPGTRSPGRSPSRTPRADAAIPSPSGSTKESPKPSPPQTPQAEADEPSIPMVASLAIDGSDVYASPVDQDTSVLAVAAARKRLSIAQLPSKRVLRGTVPLRVVPPLLNIPTHAQTVKYLDGCGWKTLPPMTLRGPLDASIRSSGSAVSRGSRVNDSRPSSAPAPSSRGRSRSGASGTSVASPDKSSRRRGSASSAASDGQIAATDVDMDDAFRPISKVRVLCSAADAELWIRPSTTKLAVVSEETRKPMPAPPNATTRSFFGRNATMAASASGEMPSGMGLSGLIKATLGRKSAESAADDASGASPSSPPPLSPAAVSASGRSSSQLSAVTPQSAEPAPEVAEVVFHPDVAEGRRVSRARASRASRPVQSVGTLLFTPGAIVEKRKRSLKHAVRAIIAAKRVSSIISSTAAADSAEGSPRIAASAFGRVTPRRAPSTASEAASPRPGSSASPRLDRPRTPGSVASPRPGSASIIAPEEEEPPKPTFVEPVTSKWPRLELALAKGSFTTASSVLTQVLNSVAVKFAKRGLDEGDVVSHCIRIELTDIAGGMSVVCFSVFLSTLDEPSQIVLSSGVGASAHSAQLVHRQGTLPFSLMAEAKHEDTSATTLNNLIAGAQHCAPAAPPPPPDSTPSSPLRGSSKGRSKGRDTPDKGRTKPSSPSPTRPSTLDASAFVEDRGPSAALSLSQSQVSDAFLPYAVESAAASCRRALPPTHVTLLAPLHKAFVYDTDTEFFDGGYLTASFTKGAGTGDHVRLLSLEEQRGQYAANGIDDAAGALPLLAVVANGQVQSTLPSPHLLGVPRELANVRDASGVPVVIGTVTFVSSEVAKNAVDLRIDFIEEEFSGRDRDAEEPPSLQRKNSRITLTAPGSLRANGGGPSSPTSRPASAGGSLKQFPTPEKKPQEPAADTAADAPMTLGKKVSIGLVTYCLNSLAYRCSNDAPKSMLRTVKLAVSEGAVEVEGRADAYITLVPPLIRPMGAKMTDTMCQVGGLAVCAGAGVVLAFPRDGLTAGGGVSVDLLCVGAGVAESEWPTHGPREVEPLQTGPSGGSTAGAATTARSAALSTAAAIAAAAFSDDNDADAAAPAADDKDTKKDEKEKKKSKKERRREKEEREARKKQEAQPAPPMDDDDRSPSPPPPSNPYGVPTPPQGPLEPWTTEKPLGGPRSRRRSSSVFQGLNASVTDQDQLGVSTATSERTAPPPSASPFRAAFSAFGTPSANVSTAGEEQCPAQDTSHIKRYNEGLFFQPAPMLPFKSYADGSVVEITGGNKIGTLTGSRGRCVLRVTSGSCTAKVVEGFLRSVFYENKDRGLADERARDKGPSRVMRITVWENEEVQGGSYVDVRIRLQGGR